jgi:O-acetyl-ADP-ribose deacetylase (regulator of RNase III)
MKKRVELGDITGWSADALIYSTNVRLARTGGVGAALLKRFGISVQIELQGKSLGTGRELAEVGDVFTTSISGAPWKRVFHTVATSELYHTQAATVRAILQNCLRSCAASSDVRSVVCSALGSGYGDLEPADFLSIVDEVLDDLVATQIEDFTVVEFDQRQYLNLSDAAGKLRGWTAGG